MNKTQQRRRANSKKIILIVIIALAVAGLTVGILALRQYEYDRGFDAGVGFEQHSTDENLSTLATAISTKEQLAEQLANLPAPTEIDTEGIDNYLSALQAVTDATNHTIVKDTLITYQGQWQKFKETYATEDNDAAATEFDQLKTASVETATKIQQILDQDIASSLEKLR